MSEAVWQAAPQSPDRECWAGVLRHVGQNTADLCAPTPFVGPVHLALFVLSSLSCTAGSWGMETSQT